MSRVRTVEIDGAKLKKLLVKRGLTEREVNDAIRYGARYMQDCIRLQRISLPVTANLEQMYNIRLEDYSPDPEPEAVPAQEIPGQMSIQDYYSDGVADALTEIRDLLKEVLKALERMGGVYE